MLQQIQNGITLRATTTVDKSAPHVGQAAVEQECEAASNENYYLDLGLEQWLPFVHDISFATTSVPLSQDDAKLLRACYKHLHGSALPVCSLPENLLLPLAALQASKAAIKRVFRSKAEVSALLNGTQADGFPDDASLPVS